MNCFQNVSLAYRLQSPLRGWQLTYCCELLSKCIFGISFTIFDGLSQRYRRLWIAFKMYLWHIVYNLRFDGNQFAFVVNCFQNVSLAYRLQYIEPVRTFNNSCELLSKCIFGISFTMIDLLLYLFTTLWIAFKMYLWHIVYNPKRTGKKPITVVNCFQNVSLAYRLQLHTSDAPANCVVNCFQNVSLAYRLQFGKFLFKTFWRCELLSKCIFGISFTIRHAIISEHVCCELLSKCIFGISFTITD